MRNMERREPEQPKIEAKIGSLIKNIDSKWAKEELLNLFVKNPEEFMELYEKAKKSIPEKKLKKSEKELKKIVEIGIEAKEKEIGALSKGLQSLEKEFERTIILASQVSIARKTEKAIESTKEIKPAENLRGMEKMMKDEKAKLKELRANLAKLAKIRVGLK
jgi:hypothetical protein